MKFGPFPGHSCPFDHRQLLKKNVWDPSNEQVAVALSFISLPISEIYKSSLLSCSLRNRRLMSQARQTRISREARDERGGYLSCQLTFTKSKNIECWKQPLVVQVYSLFLKSVATQRCRSSRKRLGLRSPHSRYPCVFRDSETNNLHSGSEERKNESFQPMLSHKHFYIVYLPMMKYWKTESLSLSMGPQISLKTKRVNGGYKSFHCVQRWAGNWCILGNMPSEK